MEKYLWVYTVRYPLAESTVVMGVTHVSDNRKVVEEYIHETIGAKEITYTLEYESCVYLGYTEENPNFEVYPCC